MRRPAGRGRPAPGRAPGRQAYDHDPRRARAAYTLFLTQFYDGRFDEAFAAALRAMEINPNASYYAARIGAAYISRGDYARGEKLIERMGLDQPPLGLFSAWLALAALMRGDEARFQRLARAPGMDDSALGLMLAMAASRQLRDARAGARAALALREQFPESPRMFPPRCAAMPWRRRLSPDC